MLRRRTDEGKNAGGDERNFWTRELLRHGCELLVFSDLQSNNRIVKESLLWGRGINKSGP